MKTTRHLLLLMGLFILPIVVATAVASPPQQSNALVCGVDSWDYETVYDFEADDGGFVPNTPPGEWAWGASQPAPNAPPAAHSGTKLWGTNLAGNIPVEPSHHHLRKTVTLPTFAAGQLQWWDWWDEDGTDQGKVFINGEQVYLVDIDQLAWTVHQVDLTPWQGQTVEILFDYFAFPSGAGGAGWFIDDVALQSCDPTPTPDLQFSRMAAPATAVANTPINYAITLFNSGAQDAVGSTMIDDLPVGSTYVAGSATNGATYNSNSHQIEWSGTVPAAETVVVSFQMTTASAGSLSNNVTIDHTSLNVPLVLTAETQTAVAAAYPMCEGFEGGSLPNTMLAEVTQSGSASGRVAVTGAHPFEGSFGLDVDTDCGGLCGVGTFTTQAAILAANLTGQSQVALNFQIYNHGDEVDEEDGVFISDDGGATYAKVYDFGLLPTHYQNVVINLGQAAADAGLTLNGGFLIKFQSYDNSAIANDGFSLDNVCVQRLDRPELTVNPTPITSSQASNTQAQRPLTLNNSGGGELTWQFFEAGTTMRIVGDVGEETEETAVASIISAVPQPTLAELAAEKDVAPHIRIRNDLLFDQSDNVTSLRSVNSQEYETVNAKFDSQAADDFVVPVEDGSWSVRAVEAFGRYFNSDPSGPEGLAPLVNVYFYEDDNGLPGTAVYSANGLAPTYDYDGTLVVDLPMPALLPPGTYWFSIQADMDFATGGQWYWYERTVQTGHEFAWRNPEGGLGIGCPTWGSSTTCGFDRPDLGFRLAGTRADCIPQDISWLALPKLAGHTAADSKEDIAVVFDANGLADGQYNGELCLISNDPGQPIRNIPAQLTVRDPIVGDYMLHLPAILRQ